MKGYNLVQVLEKSIVDHWNSKALSDYKASSFTYGEVGARIAKLHRFFESCGIKQSDKIALIGKNSTQWGITYLATITYGATIVPVLPDFHPDNMQNIIEHSDSKILLIDQGIFQKLNIQENTNLIGILNLDDYTPLGDLNTPEFSQECTNLVKNLSVETKKEESIPIIKFPQVDDNSIAVISYTSGTTGFSKGVMLTLDSLMANVHFAWNNMPLQAADKLLSILPLAHAYGCAFEFLWPFTIGVDITFMGKTVSQPVLIQAFQELKPRLILMVPLILEKIYKKQLLPLLSKTSMKILLTLPLINSLIYNKIKAKLSDVFGGNFREVVIGGAALNKEVERFLRKIGFNYSVGYGMTECGPLISYSNWDKTALGSCGKLVDSLEITIDSPDKENIPGEIMLKGTNVMKGYYKNPTETGKVIDEQGWLHTGDLGVVDANGFIHIRGRSKCMILGPSGENIYPEEIESKLSTFPYVLEDVVISDKNKLVALVFPDFEKAQKEGVGETELADIMENNKNEINKSLPKYSQISRIQIQKEEFEKTPKQSIKRFLYESKN